jgi:hypothetical protein
MAQMIRDPRTCHPLQIEAILARSGLVDVDIWRTRRVYDAANAGTIQACPGVQREGAGATQSPGARRWP